MGKAAAVAPSQSCEVTAFRELITELKRKGMLQLSKTLENKQEPEERPPFLSLSAAGVSCYGKASCFSCQQTKKQTQNGLYQKRKNRSSGFDCNKNRRFGKCESKRWVLGGH